MARFDSGTIKLSLIDALLGVVIGSVSIATSRSRLARNVSSDVVDFADMARFSVFFFGGAFFLATLLLAPFLIRWLRARLALPHRRYYRDAMLGGIMFGIGASAAVGLFFPLTMALVPNVKDYTLYDRFMLTLAGPFLFVPSALLIAVVVCTVQLIVFGVSFGLLNGWMVKRTWPASSAAAS